ncbi:MAG: chemotaxis protein CheC [Gammaproteobacteria bacterium]|nr:chemotaxis protein CheC [Gammaproteobacteria bacterium]
MTMQAYTEDQNDALQEVVNIAMGQAGDSLARILGNFVELSVPRIRLVTVKDVISTVTEMVDTNAEISAVRQAFSNSLRGEAIVVFAQSGADDLADLMGYDTDLDQSAEQELLLEVSNLLVGAIITGIAETLETDLSFSAPSLMAERKPLDQVLIPEQLSWSHALLMEVNFTVEGRDFKCHILMFMTEEAIDTLRSILDDFMDAI